MILYNSSALPRIVTCHGSVALSAQAPPREQTDASEEGTAFHHFAALLLDGNTCAVGDKAPNGFIADAEMLDHAEAYADLLKSDAGWTQRVEAPMHWGPGGTANDSQPWQVRVKVDNVTWRPDISTLAVTDAKYGFRYVEVQDNWQLLSQAIGACFALRIQPQRIILAIYQPRGPGEALRWVEITPQELLAAYSVLCETLSNLTNSLQTSDHCKYCPAALGCPAYERALYNALDVAMTGDVLTLPAPEQIRAKLDLVERAAELIKQSKSLLENHALAELRNGKPLPGLYTKPQLGNTTWLKSVDVVALKMKGNNLVDEKPVTPAEAKRRGLSEEDCAAMTHRPVIGVKLMRGVASDEAAKVFADKKPRKKKT